MLAETWRNTSTLLAELGPEPLGADFGDLSLARIAWPQRTGETFLMDQRVVVGVGNIYAAEALFAAGIHPIAQRVQ